MAIPRIKNPNKLDQSNIYRDFSMSFDKHPLSNDVIMKTDTDAVKESLKNIIMTDRGSRLFQPEMGGDIRKLLFENKHSEALTKRVETDVANLINRYEPRVTLESVSCVSDADDNAMHITIYFYVINSETLLSTTVIMEKIR